MSDKRMVSAEDLKQALEKALNRREECAGMKVLRVYEAVDGPSNWDAEIVAKDDDTMKPECKRVMLATKLGIQSRLGLATN